MFKYANKSEDFIEIVGCHPSIGAAGAFGENPDDLVKGVKCPAYLMPAGNDADNLKTDGEYFKILISKFGNDKVACTEFPDMIHGFVVRGDVSDEKVKRDVEKVIDLSVQYMNKLS